MRSPAVLLALLVTACQAGAIQEPLDPVPDAPAEASSDAPTGSHAPDGPPPDAGPGLPDAHPAPDARPTPDARPDAPPLPDATPVSEPDAPPILQPDASVGSGCPPEMVQIGTFCVDAYEAYVVEVVAGPDGPVEQPHSPYLTVDGLTLRAKSAAGVVPQAYISQVQATAACANAGKRLCTATEFSLACRGPDPANWYPYGGQSKSPGACNEGKGSFVAKLFGTDPNKWTYANFNDPRLNQLPGGLAKTGEYVRCVSPAGVHDCVGNLHEWGADAADVKGHGRFRGGFYGDAEVNGHGCLYVTSAHELAYHDYSTGFRCCADALP